MNQFLIHKGYVDDHANRATRKYDGTLVELMQNALSVVDNWCNDRGLSVNPDKTELMVFTRRRKLPVLVNPKFKWQKGRLLHIS